MVFVGLGMGPGFPLYTLAVQNAVPRDRIGVASSVNRFFSQVGSTVGAALMGTVLITTLKTDIPRYLPAASKATSAQVRVNTNEVQNPGAIRLAVDRRFNATYEEIAAALRGSALAYRKVESNRIIPAAFRAAVKPGGIPAEVRQITEATVRTFTAALNGDASAKTALLADPRVPRQAKALLADPPRTAQGRTQAEEVVRQAFLSAEPTEVSKAETSVLGKVHANLNLAARAYDRDLVRGLDTGITDGVRVTYVYGAGFILLALLATLPMPDVRLKGRREQQAGEDATLT